VPVPPSLADLQQLAERAIGHAEGEAQVTVLWESGDGAPRIEFTAVAEGRAAAATATGADDAQLRRGARAAATLARRPRAWPSAGLAEPQPARGHDGFDPAVLRAEPISALEVPGAPVSISTGASRIAIASTRGVRAAEQRTYAIAEATAGDALRRVRLRRAAVSPADLDPEALSREAAELLRPGRALAAIPAGDLPVVFGPDAVAVLLEHLRAAFGVELDLGAGPLAGRTGTRVAAAAINLSDSPRHHSTLPRSFDAEGVPRRPVPLIQDGVAHRRVHDTASAARAGTQSTGHATRAAAMAPVPEHLVLVGGGAASIEELCAPVARGLYVPSLSRARQVEGGTYVHSSRGALLLEAGERADPVADEELLVDPLAVLAGTEALTAFTRVIPMSGHAPSGIGAAVVPGIRCIDGCRARKHRK
jgi:predicted Zn-dependent protease